MAKDHGTMTTFIIPGFRASAAAVGLKKNGNPDIGLIVSEKEAVAAAVFTTNKVKAAPVMLSREHVRDGKARAIIANAGNANACTGDTGLKNARLTAELVAGELGTAPEEVLVASTGVIGSPLNMNLISKGVPELVKSLSPEGFSRVAEAIMTTDSFSKSSRFEGEVQGKPYRIFGIAKGAGMIMPNMATMLCFVVTDIAVQSTFLREALLESVKTTFNRITVDGDTSTNDCVMVMANGMAENPLLSKEDGVAFKRGLANVLGDLATMMVRDGEGASKVVHVKVKGAASASDAETAARTIANSLLVKTACYGQDPNWGRIMAAVGRSGITMEEHMVDIWVNDVKIVEGGLGVGQEAEFRATEHMKEKQFALIVDLHQGPHEDRILTCDLTHEYVSINADYRT